MSSSPELKSEIAKMSMQKFVWLVLLLCVGRARPQDNHMYSYFDEHSTIIAKGDSEFDFIKLETPIHFYSEQYDHIYVSVSQGVQC